MWIYEIKKSFQFEVQKLHAINKIKCLILEIGKLWKTTFCLTKKQQSHILLLLGMDTHKKQKLLLMTHFKKCTRKKKSAKIFESLLILNAFQILNDLSLYIRSNLDVLYLLNLSVQWQFPLGQLPPGQLPRMKSPPGHLPPDN